ncbi:MAG TPA: hypothetical protein IAA20_05110, partial [Candidatus Enterococcus avicola]|nr:hypothetical protein [Candidatus Enterococcus avicola]
MKCNECNRVQL